MPGGLKGKAKHKRKGHVKVKKQKMKYMRSKDPLVSVFMWGVQHSINELTTIMEPSLLLPEDFKAFSKIRVENQYFNKETLPGHFKFKEYTPRVFHDLRKRHGMDDLEYMHSLVVHPPVPTENPGRSGARFFLSHDKKLIIKCISSEEVAMLHQIIQPYHAHVVTQEGKTLLPQYLGMYRLTVNNAETYWIVMRNVFSCRLKMHLKFDLKGSTVDRSASDKEKAKGSPIFKDNDFIQMKESISIGEKAKKELFKLLEADVQLLQSLNLMDYSLLVGIHDCTAPFSDSEEDEDWEDGNGYVSTDEVEAPPHSPVSPISGEDQASPSESAQPGTRVKLPSVGSQEDHSAHSASPEPAKQSHSPSDPENNSTPADSEPHPSVEPAKEGSEGGSGTENTETVTGATASNPEPKVEETVAVSLPAVVCGEKAMEAALLEGFYPVVDRTVDIFAIPSTTESAHPQIYFMGIIDVLTNYGARKRAAHAAKTMKHGHGAEISTVKPEQYGKRFLDFMQKIIV